jgi:hypothetical protein
MIDTSPARPRTVAAIDNPEVSPVMDATKLKSQTAKTLAEMAKRKGVPGWHSMRKEELVRALLKQVKAAGKTNGTRNGDSGGHASRPQPLAKRSAVVERRLNQIKSKLAESKDLALRTAVERNGHAKDRLVVIVRDAYWLHVYWELTRPTVERARAAMGQHWHGARPVLRLHEVTADGTTSSARRVVRHIEIHGGVNNWYIDVPNPPKSYQLDIGYLAPCGKFYALARSNVVTTPTVPAGQTFDQNWADIAKDYDRIYAMSGGYAEANSGGELREVFEEHLRRPMGPPIMTRLGINGMNGSNGNGSQRSMHFEVDAELVVFGAAEPGSHVTVRGEPVRVESDGSFVVRYNLPDRRQVLPIVAASGDGGEQRTIVLAVERNTKVMEPVVRESVEP